MSTRYARKNVIIGVALASLFVSPALAQSYSATYGTGNVINLPLAEQSNGAAGFGPSAYNGPAHYASAPIGSSAYASVPRRAQSFTAKEKALFDHADEAQPD
jgi:hypothetical protein